MDLRFCLKKSDSQFYFVHGLYCEEILSPLISIKNYLDDHPQEIVVLDCQHFYNFQQEHHVKLINILSKLFSSKIFSPRHGDLSSCTLNTMSTSEKQILIIYRWSNNSCPDKFWRSYQWPTPWPNQIKISKLKDSLSESLKRRPFGYGYVTQCVLTPSADYIIPRFLSSLRRSCARKIDKKLTDWIKEQKTGPYGEDEPPTANVFLADFVDLNNNAFCRNVIDLNCNKGKLIEE